MNLWWIELNNKKEIEMSTKMKYCLSCLPRARSRRKVIPILYLYFPLPLQPPPQNGKNSKWDSAKSARISSLRPCAECPGLEPDVLLLSISLRKHFISNLFIYQKKSRSISPSLSLSLSHRICSWFDCALRLTQFPTHNTFNKIIVKIIELWAIVDAVW